MQQRNRRLDASAETLVSFGTQTGSIIRERRVRIHRIEKHRVCLASVIGCNTILLYAHNRD